eukprot:11715275-Prorocentrum_lima.AAC.1
MENRVGMSMGYTSAYMVQSTGPACAPPHNQPFDHLNFSTAQIEEHFDEDEELACVHESHS